MKPQRNRFDSDIIYIGGNCHSLLIMSGNPPILARLAQLVKSISLTLRGSLVRIQYLARVGPTRSLTLDIWPSTRKGRLKSESETWKCIVEPPQLGNKWRPISDLNKDWSLSHSGSLPVDIACLAQWTRAPVLHTGRRRFESYSEHMLGLQVQWRVGASLWPVEAGNYKLSFRSSLMGKDDSLWKNRSWFEPKHRIISIFSLMD